MVCVDSKSRGCWFKKIIFYFVEIYLQYMESCVSANAFKHFIAIMAERLLFDEPQNWKSLRELYLGDSNSSYQCQHEKEIIVVQVQIALFSLV